MYFDFIFHFEFPRSGLKYSFDLLCCCIREKQALLIHSNALIYHEKAQTQQCQLFLEWLAQVSKHQPDSKEIHLVELPKLQYMRL
jgi:hypothetical protein